MPNETVGRYLDKSIAVWKLGVKAKGIKGRLAQRHSCEEFQFIQ